jgi:hypothetical protein
MRRHILPLWLFAAALLVVPMSYGQDEPADQKSEDVSSEDVSPEDLKSDVLQWVDELDATSLSSRRAAEKALIGAGPDALKFLPESKTAFSIEAVERLARVRKAIQAMRTKTETRSELIRVRLDEVSTLGEALEAISRDSGIEFEHEADESMAVTPVEAQLSFWHAVDLVATGKRQQLG